MAGRNRARLIRDYGESDGEVLWLTAFLKHEMPRCGAKCRDGHACRAHAVWDRDYVAPRNGRCKNHGGLSTGAKTPEGKQRQAEGRARARRRRQEATEPSC